MTQTDTQTNPIREAFELLRAVDHADDGKFRAAIADGINPATIVTLANIALACGADQSGGSTDAWLTGLETKLIARTESEPD